MRPGAIYQTKSGEQICCIELVGDLNAKCIRVGDGWTFTIHNPVINELNHLSWDWSKDGYFPKGVQIKAESILDKVRREFESIKEMIETDYYKDVAYAKLMTIIERHYEIPLLKGMTVKDPIAFALYKEISDARTF